MAIATDEFLFDVEKWFADVVQQRMSFAEKGVYLDMLFQEWRMREHSLPDDPQLVADLIAINEAQVAEVLAAWPVVRRKFVTDRRSDGRIYNIKLEKTRRIQAKKFLEIRNRASAAGKASAAKRLGDHSLGVNGRSTAVQHPSTVRLGSSSGREGLSKERLGEVVPPAAPRPIAPPPPTLNARSRQMAYVGQRVKVFMWQFEDLCGLLGPHAEAFEFDRWFQSLDRQCLAEGTVPPERDGGAWLKAETLAEAQRRGIALRIASAAVASPATDVAAVAAILERKASR